MAVVVLAKFDERIAVLGQAETDEGLVEVTLVVDVCGKVVGLNCTEIGRRFDDEVIAC